MQIYEQENLESYKKNVLEIKPEWKNRDFSILTRQYMTACTEKVLAICGLRGTGKTVGLLQAAEGLDTAYVLAQWGEKEKGDEYVDFLENTSNHIIIIDEYGWIKERENLDRYLLTAVQNGKRVAITGTESITLSYLNYGPLCHRVDTLHTTMFPYEEYRRIYGLPDRQDICDKYLLEGGIFKEYAMKNFDSMKNYIETAVVGNLAGYLQNEMTIEEARTLTYAILFKAVCPSNLTEVPTLRIAKTTLPNFLDTMGINKNLEINECKLARVADIFEHAGIITRIPNIDQQSDIKERYYINNSSLTSQLIMAAYGLSTLQGTLLANLFKTYVMNKICENSKESESIIPTM